MTRYKTRWYCTVDAAEARRLAAIDDTPVDQIECTDGVDLVDATCGGAWWSDERLTTAIGLPNELKRRAGLPPAAARLISNCRGSDSGDPDAIGGYAALARVVACEEHVIGDRPHTGVYAPPQVRRLVLTHSDGTPRTVYLYTVGYPEGYAYDLFPTLDALVAAIPDWASRCAIETRRWFETEADFAAFREG